MPTEAQLANLRPFQPGKPWQAYPEDPLEVVRPFQRAF